MDALHIIHQLKDVLKDVEPRKARELMKEAMSSERDADKFANDLELVMRSIGKLSLKKVTAITKEVHAKVYGETERKTRSKSNKPNAYIEFMKQNLPGVKASYPALSHHDRVKIIAKMWNDAKANDPKTTTETPKKRQKPAA